jgi:pimeloyl-ACP methyl ester carboxylesterase
VQVGEYRYAYRRLGNPDGSPVIFLQHYRGNMDDWNPIITDALAAEHEVILFDNARVALSSGQTPGSVLAMANHVPIFTDAIGLTHYDIMGYSLGGFIAQHLALAQSSSISKNTSNEALPARIGEL